MRLASLALHTRFVTQLYRWLGFRLALPAPELPARGSVVLAAHYNGLLDGFVYTCLSARMLAVLSAQWHRTALGRLLLPGVAVTRSKDQREGEAAGSNTAAFKTMQSIVREGFPLLYFPEGTSRLGSERLPVQRGTELLLRRIRAEQPEVPVYFAAAHYDNPTRWRSRVALAVDGPHTIPAGKDGLAEWVAAGLLRAQSKAQALPLPACSGGLQLLRRMLAALALLPVLPAFFAARLAIRRCADDTNVISLWRLLGGVPAALLCWLLWAIVALVCSPLWLALAVPLLTLLGVALWCR